MSFFHLRNNSVQVKAKRSITHQHKVICRYSLSPNTLHALSEIVGFFFIVNRHQYRIVHFKNFSPFSRRIYYFPVKASSFSSNSNAPPIAVVWPTAMPSVLSGRKSIFMVAKIMRRSSIKLGFAMYIRSICSLS